MNEGSESIEAVASPKPGAVALQDTITELRGELETSRKPWYRETPTVISFIALVLSLITTAVSGVTSAIREREIDHENLRSHVEYLLELPQKQAELHGLLRADKDILYQANSASSLQGKLRGELASNLIDKLGPENFSPSLHVALSITMLNSQDPERALEFVEFAERASDTTNDQIKIAQAKGAIGFAQGNINTGRRAMNAAEKIIKTDLPKDAYLSKVQLVDHYVTWYQLEAFSDTAEATRIIKLAEAETSKLNDSPQKRRIIEIIKFMGGNIFEQPRNPLQ